MENTSLRYGFVGDARRLAEILSVANKNNLTQGLTPERVANTFKQLGTAFIKIGQVLSLHPEVLPPEYCEKLKGLRNDVPSINASMIRDIISEEYGRPWNTVFSKISGIPEGSASIAQVHEARLLDGTRVAIKVQRPDSYQMMEQDIRLLKRALNVLKLKELEDKKWILENAIDETWRVAKEEMDFIKEAANIERMAKILEPMAFATTPGVYHEYTTKDVLVMEFIDGIDLEDIEGLKAAGYDIREVCTKLIRSYIKQWAEDQFFQADPHPGNVRIRDGQIVWLDLGMMGELTDKETECLHHCMHAILKNDIDELMEWGWILLDMPDNYPKRAELTEVINRLLNKYRAMTVSDMNSSSEVIDDIMDLLTNFYINIPIDLNMYGRSLVIMEGTVADLDPDSNLVDIIAVHLAAYAIGNGKAGEIARKLSHRKLISGKPLRHSTYQEEDIDPTDQELLTEEEYAILSEEKEERKAAKQTN